MYLPGPERRRMQQLLSALLVWAMCGLAQALPEDREQPIRITADQAIRDEKQGFTVYQGNVKMRQGSMQIDARKLTVFHAVQDAERILAEGSPAHMQQQPEPGQGLMHARAERIEYFKAGERVLLTVNASIEQDGSTVTGDSIEYLITEQLVRADSTPAAGSRNRVEVVIPARNLPEAAPTAPDPNDSDSAAGADGATDGE